MAKDAAPLWIPAGEEPYPVPQNWRWVTFDTVCSGFQYGYTAKAVREPCGPRFIRITDIGDGIIDEERAPFCVIPQEEYPKYKIHKNDIFIARIGSVGENGLATHDIDGVFASYLIRLVPRIDTLFVRDFLQSDVYWEQIADNSKGSTRLNVNANVLRRLKFPLPPFPEQCRIVNRIESLCTKLDEARIKLQLVSGVPGSQKAAICHLDAMKQAILGRAFRGRLGTNHPEEESAAPLLEQTQM